MTASHKAKLAPTIANTAAIRDSDLEDEAKNPRQYPRRAIHWKARIITSQKKLLIGETINISQKGAMITLDIKLPDGEKVLVEIQSFFKGKKRDIKARGIVRHCSMSSGGVNVGIFFKETTPEAHDFLEKFTTGLI